MLKIDVNIIKNTPIGDVFGRPVFNICVTGRKHKPRRFRYRKIYKTYSFLEILCQTLSIALAAASLPPSPKANPNATASAPTIPINNI